MPTRILNFGSLNIDHVYHVDQFVKPGETKLSKNLTTFAGGKGNNQSIALARAGASVYHAGAIGQDGQFLLNNLKKEGVNTDFIEINPNLTTGHAIIQVNDNGENNIILSGGANQAIKGSYIQQVLSNFREGDILLIQNEISNLSTLIKLAGEKKMHIYFNPAPMSQNVLDYPLEYINTFIVNYTEAQAITQESDSDRILEKMAKLFPNSNTILTLGSDGVIYQNCSETIKQSAYPAKAIDTTAAGDTFLGYFIACQQKNMSVKDSLDIGCKAAAITVTREGAVASVPYWNEVIS